jgi:16S rRNA (guanine527-N7)-methyltransferase
LHKIIKKELEAVGFNVGNVELGQMVTFISLLKKWNRTHNLTALKEDLLIVRKLFSPSLSFSRCINMDSGCKVLDLGTGAGFPGIPLKIVFPCLNITLLDSSSKKIAFLKNIIPALSLSNVRCINERSEFFSSNLEERESYEHVVAMAVASLSKLMELSFPLLVKGGTLITIKGNLLEEEIKAAETDNRGFKIGKIEKISQQDNSFSLISIIKCFT